LRALYSRLLLCCLYYPFYAHLLRDSCSSNHGTRRKLGVLKRLRDFRDSMRSFHSNCWNVGEALFPFFFVIVYGKERGFVQASLDLASRLGGLFRPTGPFDIQLLTGYNDGAHGVQGDSLIFLIFLRGQIKSHFLNFPSRPDKASLMLFNLHASLAERAPDLSLPVTHNHVQ
jgi:hypothetical protein